MAQDELNFDDQGIAPQGWREWWLTIQALFWLIIIDWAVKRFGFGRTTRALARYLQKAERVTSPPRLPVVWRWAGVMLFANRRIKLHPVACLAESMMLWFLLRRRGAPAHLLVGVRTLTGFESHAWVTYQGRVLNDFEDAIAIYTPLDLPLLRPKRETS